MASNILKGMLGGAMGAATGYMAGTGGRKKKEVTPGISPQTMAVPSAVPAAVIAPAQDPQSHMFEFDQPAMSETGTAGKSNNGLGLTKAQVAAKNASQAGATTNYVGVLPQTFKVPPITNWVGRVPTNYADGGKVGSSSNTRSFPKKGK